MRMTTRVARPAPLKALSPTSTRTIEPKLSSRTFTTITASTLYAGSLRVARLDTSSGTGYNTYEYFHVDPLGSTRMVTSSTKSVLFTDSYQPFGQDNGTPTGSSAEKFAGKSWSTSINLYYFYMRWYDPTIRRFISVDPKAGRFISVTENSDSHCRLWPNS